MEKYTWEQKVEKELSEILDEASKGDTITSAFYMGAHTQAREHFNTISLARIATALYKLAGIPDEVDKDYFNKIMEE